jgi:hypothetical protein
MHTMMRMVSIPFDAGRIRQPHPEVWIVNCDPLGNPPSRINVSSGITIHLALEAPLALQI